MTPPIKKVDADEHYSGAGKIKLQLHSTFGCGHFSNWTLTQWRTSVFPLGDYKRKTKLTVNSATVDTRDNLFVLKSLRENVRTAQEQLQKGYPHLGLGLVGQFSWIF